MNERNSRNKRTVVKGDGNVVGDHNQVNSSTTVLNEQHVHNHQTPRKSNSSSSGDDAIGFAASIGLAVVTGLWLFFRHSAELYYYVKLASVVALGLALVATAIRALWSDRNGPTTLDIAASLILSLAVFISAMYCERQLNPQLSDLATSAKNGIEFWKGLNSLGQRLAVETALAGALLLLGTSASMFASLRIFSLGALGASDFDYWVTRFLYPFRPSRSVVLGAVACVFAIASASGALFQLIDYTRSRGG
jgi:hypothetical protein